MNAFNHKGHELGFCSLSYRFSVMVVLTASWLLTQQIKAERRCQHFLLGPTGKERDERDEQGAIQAGVREMIFYGSAHSALY